MNETTVATDRDIDVLDLLAALNAGKRYIIVGPLLLCILAGALSFLVPKEYEAHVQLLPPKEQRKGFGFSELLSALPIPSLRLGEKGTPADIFIAILKSPTMRREMVQEFDLVQVYEADSVEDAIEALKQKTSVGKSDEGTILIDVLDRDPQRAAAMANRYWALLDSTNQTLSRTAARDRYQFIVKLKEDEGAKLQVAMDSLQAFQAEHNAISIEDQARAVIGAAAQMEMASAELEIAIQSLRTSGAGQDHPQVKKLQNEFMLRQEYLSLLQDGVEGSQSTPKGVPRLQLHESLFLPLREIPKVAQDYANIEKDVLVQSALLKLLLEQEAEALIEARNDASTVQVLDAAQVPVKKARPQRFLIVFVTGVLSMFAAIAYVLGRVYVRGLQATWRQRYGT